MRLVATAILAIASAGSAPPAASEPGAIQALNALLGIERNLLAGDLERCEESARRRTQLAARLGEAQAAADAAVRASEVNLERLDQLRESCAAAEVERATAEQAWREALGLLRERWRRIAALEQQLTALSARQVVAGALTGSWDLVFLPVGTRGSCVLTQSGALVSGTYELEGGQSGSFEGTLVNRKVYLVRIDSKLGRSMELEGFLASDGRQIRGTWSSYEQADGQRPTGQWSAQRRTANQP
ncbi:MAG TPA: hypothetical protein VJS92_01825 [Candidatus Polarisedimenticolaceae bacterium]|nr:hypothetical protein [Candidatus Polarisedimenticolaceae bacterium]